MKRISCQLKKEYSFENVDKYNTHNLFPAGTRKGDAFNTELLSKLEGLTDVMKDIGSKHGAGHAQFATAWAIAKGTVPILGITKTSHIKDVVSATMVTLSSLNRRSDKS
ncbi:hypothetical protein BpJC7_22790 [Weizmannia acidilactici]|uniref:NADP-dependent oxidoreductase domain-containing protein n=1 Tax=Weizmannia acidilactici TaxID=2607726 RepID=A0A5J4J7U6_9BACI|nr:aldo/keto reductase [Weizmannia acidilactici]GER68304.1 hypothetical protein BpJC4_27750 [Weizmannia acidilactici]GER70976.1 hypothetical protein BpJC7_22790 [Weizmannia acidilactici]GER74593.1 hypothetical protein BpPP18_26600 [Weizmannia acidilactici]